MASESGAELGHGGGSAADRAADLTMGGSGHELGGDGGEEAGSFEIVGGGEGLAGERAPTGRAAVAGYGAPECCVVVAVAARAVARRGAAVLAALGPRTETRAKRLQALDRGAWLVHAACWIMDRASALSL